MYSFFHRPTHLTVLQQSEIRTHSQLPPADPVRNIDFFTLSKKVNHIFCSLIFPGFLGRFLQFLGGNEKNCKISWAKKCRRMRFVLCGFLCSVQAPRGEGNKEREGEIRVQQLCIGGERWKGFLSPLSLSNPEKHPSFPVYKTAHFFSLRPAESRSITNIR